MRSDHNYDLVIQQVLCFLFVFFLFKVWDAIRPRALEKKSGFVLVWWGFKKDLQIVWKWKTCHYYWCRFQLFSYLPNQTADQLKNITTVSAGSSKHVHLQNERANIHMGGFRTNKPLVLRRQNLSFLVNMQETDQACGLKGAEEPRIV